MDRFVHDAVLDMRAARDDLMTAIGQVGPRDWSRYVPYGSRSLHDLLAHLAAADQAWALAAQGLLRGEAEDREPLTPAEARNARLKAIERGRARSPSQLLEEMDRRRKLLLSLYELLEPRHLPLKLTSFGQRHNSVRERIWVGYHDRLHAADIRRALRLNWHPPALRFLDAVRPVAEALSPDETLYVIYSVDPVLWERPSPIPGWSFRQLLAHIATGDWVLQTHLRHVIDHGRVAEWPDVDAGNAQRLDERKFSPEHKLTEEYLSMRHETMTLLAKLEPNNLALPIELWWEPRPNRHTLLEYLTGFNFHDEQHREQLRAAMRYAR